MTLTTRQRDILKAMLDANRPIGSVELAGLLRLTPRQVNYSLQGVRVWLQQHNQELSILPGVGSSVSLPSEQAFRRSNCFIRESTSAIAGVVFINPLGTVHPFPTGTNFTGLARYLAKGPG